METSLSGVPTGRRLAVRKQGRRNALAGARLRPRSPVVPPAAVDAFGGAQPGLRLGGEVRIHVVERLRAARRADHPGDVPTGCEHVADVPTDQLRRPIRGAPGSDVILL